MMLREELRRRLLEDRGIYTEEACDKCGKLLGQCATSAAASPASIAAVNAGEIASSEEARQGVPRRQARAIGRGSNADVCHSLLAWCRRGSISGEIGGG